MNQFYKIYADAVVGRQGVVSASTHDFRQQAFGILFSHRLPHALRAQIIFEAALIVLLARRRRSFTVKTNKESRFLLDVISRSFLIASIAMHFHGGVISPGAVRLRVSFLPERLDTELSIAASE